MEDVTAAIIVIGNEILSGRTQDININYLAKQLNELSIKLTHVRIIGDIEKEIINNVNELRIKHTYLFTTGGIGPTHDDITSSSIAKAFGVPFEINREAKKIMEDHYQEELNESRLRMAYIPVGANLIPNKISKAPGFFIENTYIFAGVPQICQSMFLEIKDSLKKGKKLHSKIIKLFIKEGVIAKDLSLLQDRHPIIQIGSYPFNENNEWGTELVFSSHDLEKLEQALNELKDILPK